MRLLRSWALPQVPRAASDPTAFRSCGDPDGACRGSRVSRTSGVLRRMCYGFERRGYGPSPATHSKRAKCPRECILLLSMRRSFGCGGCGRLFYASLAFSNHVHRRLRCRTNPFRLLVWTQRQKDCDINRGCRITRRLSRRNISVLKSFCLRPCSLQYGSRQGSKHQGMF
jgi:hypothetical protein